MHGLALDAGRQLQAQGLVGNQIHPAPKQILEEALHTEAARRCDRPPQTTRPGDNAKPQSGRRESAGTAGAEAAFPPIHRITARLIVVAQQQAILTTCNHGAPSANPLGRNSTR